MRTAHAGCNSDVAHSGASKIQTRRCWMGQCPCQVWMWVSWSNLLCPERKLIQASISGQISSAFQCILLSPGSSPLLCWTLISRSHQKVDTAAWELMIWRKDGNRNATKDPENSLVWERGPTSTKGLHRPTGWGPSGIKRNQVITFKSWKEKASKGASMETRFTLLVFSTKERRDPLANQAKGKPFPPAAH